MKRLPIVSGMENVIKNSVMKHLIKKLVKVMKYLLVNVIGIIWIKIINVNIDPLKYEYIYD